MQKIDLRKQNSKNLNDKVIELKRLQNKIEVKTLKSGILKGDIVVNVSGPVSLFRNYNEVPLETSKKVKNLMKEVLFLINSFKLLITCAPGTLSQL